MNRTCDVCKAALRSLPPVVCDDCDRAELRRRVAWGEMMQRERDWSRAQLAKAREALAFYADESSWTGNVSGAAVMYDEGRRARDYLAGKVEK